MGQHMSIGIIAKKQNQPEPFGLQNTYFEEMSIQAEKLGVELVFIDYQSALTGINNVWRYNRHWEMVERPIPKILYDRVTCQTLEQKNKLNKFLQSLQQNGCLIFNSPKLTTLMDDKLNFSLFCEKHKLPAVKCVPVNEINWEWLHDGGSYYLKPRYGFGGQGIKLLEAKDSVIHLKSPDNKMDAAFPKNLLSQQKIIDEYALSYVASPALEACKINNSCFDIRVLVQKNAKNKEPLVAGIVTRVGNIGMLTSNISSSGFAMPIELLFDELGAKFKNIDNEFLYNEIVDLCLHGSRMFEPFGGAADIGFDIIIKSDFSPVILEVNSKPGRWAFSQVAQNPLYSSKLRQKYAQLRHISVLNPIKYGVSLL